MKKLKVLFSGAHTRTLVLIGLLAVTLAIPITLRLVGEQQDLRQQASESLSACLAGCKLDPDDIHLNETWEVTQCRQSCESEDESRCLETVKYCPDGSQAELDSNCNPICTTSKNTNNENEVEDEPTCTYPNDCGDTECTTSTGEKGFYRRASVCTDSNGVTKTDWGKCDPACGGGSNDSSEEDETSSSICSSGCERDADCSTGEVCTRSGLEKCGECTQRQGTDTSPVGVGDPDNDYRDPEGNIGGQSCSSLSTSNPDGCSCQTKYQCSSRTCTDGTCGGTTNTSASTSTCFGRVSYFVKDTEGNRIDNTGITIDVSGPAGNFTAQPIPFYNNASYRLAIEQLPEGEYSVNMNLGDWHLIELDGTNHAQFFSENSLRVDCPPDLDPIRQDILIMYADLIVSDTEPGPEDNLTCGTRCSNDSTCAGSTDGCSTCTGTETEKRFGRGRCTSDGTEPSPTPKLTCGSSCTDDSTCAGSTDGCTQCSGSRFRSGTCIASTVSPTEEPTSTPTNTPTATPPVACGVSCDTDSTCAGATDGCTKCVATSPGSRAKTCQREGITPTQPPQTGDTRVTINAKMPGIGTNTGDNSSPNNPNRTATVEVFDVNNTKVEDGSGTVTYDGSGTYSGEINLGQNIPEGFYYMKIGFDNTLLSQIPGIQELKKDTVNNTPEVTLVPGDLNSDNLLEIEDYNIFYGCIKNEICSHNHRGLSDFNDDGSIGPVDYNILLRSYAIRPGD